MNIISVIGVLLFIAVFVYVFFGPSKKDKEQENEAGTDDELLYDPDTGKTFSIEEAEAGLSVSEEDLNRIIPQEELDKNFSEKNRKIEEANNYLKRSGYKFRFPSEETISVLSETELLADYNFVTVTDHVSLSEKASLLVTNVTYSMPSNVKGPKGGTDTRTTGMITLNEAHEGFIVAPLNSVEAFVNDIVVTGETIYKGYRIYSPEEALFSFRPEALIDYIENKKSDFTFELVNNALFIFTNETYDLESTKEMASFTLSLSRTLVAKGY